jgi:L-threonylcarbamoyladenylate synthase
VNAVDALRAGLPAILPADTVYGLFSLPTEDACARLYTLKGREARKPSALLAADLAALLAALPELPARDESIARALLPGPYTLILANPAGRYPWLAGDNRTAIGVRVPSLPEASASVVAAVGALASTSANAPGGPDPRRLEDVPPGIRAAVGAAVDGGELPGTPSTVLDFTGGEPRVLREGAAPSAEAIARAVAAVA